FAFGPDELGRVLEAVQIGGEAVPEVSIDALYNSLETPTLPRLRTTPRHLAYMKIPEGCDHTCAFCAIAGFRGRFRSRTVASLAAEAARLAEDGARELILVSQDTLAYGKDLDLKDDLERLLEALLEVN